MSKSHSARVVPAATGAVVVVGLGEVGGPLLELIGERYAPIGVDLEPVEISGPCDIMHICYPFQIEDFVGQCAAYIEKYRPGLTIVDSTVAPGTTRAIYRATGTPIVYSPVRGKHARMKQELLHYTKFVGAIDADWSRAAAAHFQSLGMQTKILTSPEAVELAKLAETTYFGLQVTWAQEVERYCDQLSLAYDDVVSFFEEIGYLPPVKYTPGIIGGHCVMPNVSILQTVFDSDLLNAMVSSNLAKKQRESRTGAHSETGPKVEAEHSLTPSGPGRGDGHEA